MTNGMTKFWNLALGDA